MQMIAPMMSDGVSGSCRKTTPAAIAKDACSSVKGVTRDMVHGSGIANQLWTPFTLLIAWPLVGERPSLRVLLGVTIALSGVRRGGQQQPE
jgi:hypothetical protein